MTKGLMEDMLNNVALLLQDNTENSCYVYIVTRDGKENRIKFRSKDDTEGNYSLNGDYLIWEREGGNWIEKHFTPIKEIIDISVHIIC